MRYRIELAPEAIEDLKRLHANLRTTAKDAIETHLRLGPTRTNRSRIKRLRGLSKPQYRLRVGDPRVFYDVSKGTVQVLAIVMKDDVDVWLSRVGEGS